MLSPVWRTFKPGLYKGDTTVTFVVLSKNPVVLSEAHTCSYFKINIDFQPILKVKLVDQLGHQYSSKIGFQLNEDKNNNGVVLETGC